MAVKPWRHMALSVVLALSCASSAWARAELFSDLPFPEAKQQAQKDGKVLLIDFTATWCPPCQHMEKSTWTNVDVQEWIKSNAIAVQVDVDKDEKTTAALGVEAMPTLILFTPDAGGKEFGRQVGYQSPEELLQWLKGAKSGKSAVQLDREKSAGDDSELWPRVTKARELMFAKQNPEALQEYVWLWSNLKSDHPTFGEIRNKAIPVELKQLIGNYPQAREKWIEIRDAAEKSDNRKDWLILNNMLDDNALTLAWFDKIKLDPKQRNLIVENLSFLEPPIFNSRRYADAADYLYPQPIEKIHEYYQESEKMKQPRPDTEVAKDFDPFPSMILLVYGSYIGAGREAEAKKIADECMRLDDSPQMHQALTNMAAAMQKAVAAPAASKTAGAAPNKSVIKGGK